MSEVVRTLSQRLDRCRGNAHAAGPGAPPDSDGAEGVGRLYDSGTVTLGPASLTGSDLANGTIGLAWLHA
jgi:hypothetical protein